jgi:CVNH domain
MLRNLLCGGVLLAATVSPALAASSFPYTCSEFRFAYSGANPTLQAVCLKADGSPNATSLTLEGIQNQNGVLSQGSGASAFQKSCGSIQILVDGPDVTLAAMCKMTSGNFNSTSLPLNNINNDNGKLVQGQ